MEKQMGWDEETKFGLKIVIIENIYTKQELLQNLDRLDYFFEELEIELGGEIASTIG